VPMPFDELGAVIHNVLFTPADQIEEALPGNVTGLNNRNPQNTGSWLGV
jgi:hypothetical protein